MANEITLGRALPSKNSVGGIDAIYFIQRDDLTGYTMDGTNTDVIEAVTGTPAALKYDVKGVTTFEQVAVSSIETGTTVFEQTLTVSLPKMTLQMHKELKLIAWNQPLCIIKTNNNEFFMAGKDYGLDLTGGTITSGANMSDMSGYTMTLIGREKAPANYFEATDEAGLVTAGFSIVTGS